MVTLMMTQETPDRFSRVVDELELVTLELSDKERIPIFLEATARALARAELLPDRRFLDVLQQRTAAILIEECERDK